MKNGINKQNRMDKVLKELGDVYEFNKEIRRFKLLRKKAGIFAFKEGKKSSKTSR